MKNIFHRFSNINETVHYIIGNNKQENSYIVENGSFDDLWFHATEHASCHVVAKVPKNLNKKQIKTIIKYGVQLCKQNTNNLRKENKTMFNYTKLKNVKTTEVEGMVIASDLKYVTI